MDFFFLTIIMQLSKEEIQHIVTLLLHPDSKNQELAFVLLEQYPEVIPTIIKPIEVFLVFNPKDEKLNELVKKILPSFSIQQSPIYALSLNDNLPNNSLELLEQYGEEYQQWIALDIERTKIYARFAQLGGLMCQQPNLILKYFHLTLQYFPKEEFYWLRMVDTFLSCPNNLEGIKQYKNQLIDAYNTAFELLPNSNTLVKLANFYQNNLEEMEKAKQTWERCLKLYPHDSEPLLGYATYYIKLTNWIKAKELATQALAILYTHPYSDREPAYTLLGTIEWKGFNNTDIAADYFEKAYEENEDRPDTIKQLAIFFLETKNDDLALKWHLKLLFLQPFDIFLLCQIAVLYAQTGNSEQAKNYYQQVLELAPDYGPASEGLALL